MKRHRRRRCRHCGQLFTPHPCSRYHQRYCSQPACRQASKAASQRRWLAKPANREYFCGPTHSARVQAWRKRHPGYWKRPLAKQGTALQDHCSSQPVDTADKTADLVRFALQDHWFEKPYMLLGLIAHLTQSLEQEELDRIMRRFEQLGRDIAAGSTATLPASAKTDRQSEPPDSQ